MKRVCSPPNWQSQDMFYVGIATFLCFTTTTLQRAEGKPRGLLLIMLWASSVQNTDAVGSVDTSL